MIGGAKTTISRNLDRVHLMGPRQEDLAKQPLFVYRVAG